MRYAAISHLYMEHTKLVELGHNEIFHHLSSPYILPNRLKPDSMKISISSMSCSLLSNSKKKIIIFKKITFIKNQVNHNFLEEREGLNIYFAFNC